MENLIIALEKALADSNYIAAMMIAVTIPDICGNIEYGGGSQARYVKWYKANMREMYQRGTVSAEDAYGIRCGLLHAFSSDLDKQKAVRVLKHLKFTINGMHFATAQGVETFIDGKHEVTPATVLLNAKTYAEDILAAYNKWHSNASSEVIAKLFRYPFVDFNATYLAPGIRISD